MILKEAIDLVLKSQIQLKTSYDHDLFKAILLCLQAAKRIQHVRIGQPQSSIHLLPGETKD